jgi:hypothetical protein
VVTSAHSARFSVAAVLAGLRNNWRNKSKGLSPR